MTRQLCAFWPFAPLLLGLAVAAISFIGLAKINLFAPVDITIPEGAVAYSIVAITGPEDLYRDYTLIPYATTPYPPLFYIASSMVAQAVNMPASAIIAGRLVAAISLLLALFAVFGFVTHSGRTKVAASVAVASACSIGFLSPWAITCRPDMLALALSIGGLRCIQLNRRYADYAAVIAFVLSTLTKQSYVVALMTGLFWLAYRREWTRAACIGLGYAIILLIAVAIFEQASGGWFLANIIGANVAPSVPLQPYRLSAHFFQAASVPITLSFCGILLSSSRSDDALVLGAIYALFSFAIATGSSLKAGADINYFIEPGFAFSMIAGLTWDSVQRNVTSTLDRRLIGFFVFFFVFLMPITYRSAWIYSHASTDGNVRHELALAHVKSTPGLVLIGDAGLAFRSGKPVLLLDKFNASYLADAGRIRFEELLESLERQEIAEVIVDLPLDAKLGDQPWWPLPLQNSIRRYYQPAGSIAGFSIYSPSPKSRFKSD